MRRLGDIVRRVFLAGRGRRGHRSVVGRRIAATFPSSRIGLMVFSLVVLACGTVVYAAALPSLASVSPVVADASEAVGSAVEAAAHPASDGAAVQQAASDGVGAAGGQSAGDAGDADAEGNGSENSGSAGSLLPGGEGVPEAVLPDGANGGSSQQGDQGGSAASGENAQEEMGGDSPADQRESQDSGSGQSSEGGKTQSPETSKDDNKKTDSNTESESDRWAHDYVSSKTGELTSLREELDSLNRVAANEFVANEATREGNKNNASSFYLKAQGAFIEFRDQIMKHCPDGYPGYAGDMIAMYRCVYQASDMLQRGWDDSLSSAGNTAELTAKYNSMKQSEQGYLSEYSSRATSFKTSFKA